MARASVVFHHFRHASRLLRRHPRTSSLAILALASGIGLTVTTFSVVDGLLLGTLPFEHGERYMYVASTDTRRVVPAYRMDLHDYAAMKEANTSFETFIPFLYRPINLSAEVGFPEQRDGCLSSFEFFSSMPFEPQLGRGFSAEDDVPGAPWVAVIGHDLWRQRFHGDPDVLGREIRADGEVAEIVGVMPPGFRFPVRQEIWLPLRLDPERYVRGQAPPVRVVGRLRADVRISEAQAELSALAERLIRDHPETHQGRGVIVRSYTEHYMWPWLRNSLWVLLTLVSLGLVIACANVAALLLARTLGRLKDLATFSALGASRSQVMGYVLAESLLLAVIGAAFGLLLSVVGVRAVANQMSWIPMPFWMEITLDRTVLGFSVLVTVASGVLAGIYPAWRASRADVTSLVHDGRTGGLQVRRFVRTLVIGKVGFAFLLLVCTGLFLRTTRNLDQFDLRVDTGKVLTAQVALPEADYPRAEDRAALVEQLVARVKSAPGVTSAAAATSLPTMGYSGRIPYVFERQALEGQAHAHVNELPQAHRIAVTPEFFELFDLPLHRGRPLLARDRADTRRVALINRSLAERAWPGQDAIGQRLRWEFGPATGGNDEAWATVVGVVADLWPGPLDDPDLAAIYVPHAQSGDPWMILMATPVTDPESLTALMREQLRALDGNLPLSQIQTLKGGVEMEMFHSRMFARATTVLGLVAMLFAAVGIYGVNVLSVRQRTPEIGVRMAMGARPAQIIGLILRQGWGRILTGLGVGLGLSILATPSLEWLLFGVDARDPWTFVLTAVFLSAVALLACLGPALRASGISPMEALRDP